MALNAVNFSDHRFRVPAATVLDLKQALSVGVLQLLAHWSLENILAEQSRKEELSQLKEELTAKLKILSREREEMVLQWRSDPEQQAFQEAQKLLEKVEEELTVIQTKSLDASYCLDEVAAILCNPQKFIKTESVTMDFDRTGILLDGQVGGEGEGIHLIEVELGENFRRSCVVLECGQNSLIKSIP